MVWGTHTCNIKKSIKQQVVCLKKNQNAPIDLLSIPQSGGKKCQNVHKWDHCVVHGALFALFCIFVLTY